MGISAHTVCHTKEMPVGCRQFIMLIDDSDGILIILTHISYVRQAV
jgi:hypothetical protein